MVIAIYSLLALFATFLGAITGMGGGVIMKPVMDAVGHYDSATIGVLCSVTVLAMAIVSSLRSVGSKPKIRPPCLIMLAVGSVGGGLIGQFIFDTATKNAGDSVVKIVQNSILLALIMLIFVYMIMNQQGKIKNFELKNPIVFTIVGVILGVFSSFLGIGGGPINVAILMLLFNLDIKSATFSSIITILFAQISKLTTVIFTSGFNGMDLSVLPFMVICAIVGALLGSFVNKKVKPRVVVYCFNGMQILIMGICITNIIRQAALI